MKTLHNCCTNAKAPIKLGMRFLQNPCQSGAGNLGLKFRLEVAKTGICSVRSANNAGSLVNPNGSL